MPGLGLIISIGKYGGFYKDIRAWNSWRVSLGFIALTCIAADGDGIIDWAIKWLKIQEAAKRLIPDKNGIVSVDLEWCNNDLVIEEK